MQTCSRLLPRIDARQGRSGLGIEAQRAAVARFAEVDGYTLIAEFTEVETGKGTDALGRRPQLAAALAAGKCPVIVAKLDRLSRHVAIRRWQDLAGERRSSKRPVPPSRK